MRPPSCCLVTLLCHIWVKVPVMHAFSFSFSFPSKYPNVSMLLFPFRTLFFHYTALFRFSPSCNHSFLSILLIFFLHSYWPILKGTEEQWFDHRVWGFPLIFLVKTFTSHRYGYALLFACLSFKLCRQQCQISIIVGPIGQWHSKLYPAVVASR